MKNIGSQLILLAAFFFSIFISIYSIKKISKTALEEKKNSQKN